MKKGSFHLNALWSSYECRRDKKYSLLLKFQKISFQVSTGKHKFCQKMSDIIKVKVSYPSKNEQYLQEFLPPNINDSLTSRSVLSLISHPES